MKKVLKNIFKVLGIAVGSLLGLLVAALLAMFVANVICNWNLRHYINSFEPVQYAEGEQLVPAMEDGYYTFTTDDDFNVMYLTDIHLGGGFWTYKEDKKTIYQVISMVQQEKPDLVILGGDNIFAVPGPKYHGGNTFNNKMVEKTVIKIFEHEQVYFSTVLGNHDTEAFDLSSRESIGKLFMDDDFKYCIFNQDFTDPDAKTVPSVTNQFIIVKNSNGDIRKLLLLIDTNAYIDTTIQSSIDWLYDTIHPAQIDWAESSIKEFSKKAGLPEGEYLKSLCFLHIPVGEYKLALDDLIKETVSADGTITYSNNEAVDTEFVSGFWDEELGICYGGYSEPDKSPAECDELFEVLSEQLNSMQAIFCGHDHVNNATVYYKGVMLSYGYSCDSISYEDGYKYGTYKGSTVVTIKPDGTFSQVHKNMFKDYNIDPNMFLETDVDAYYYPEYYRTVTE